MDDLSAIMGQAMGWGGDATATSAAVSPEPHVAAPLAEELGSEGTSVNSSGTAPADASPVGDLSISSQDVGRRRSQEARLTRALKSLKRERRGGAIIVSAGEELSASVGSIGPEQASEVAGLVSNSARAAGRAAKVLGESGVLWAESARGSSVGLYAVRLGGARVVSLALGSDIPLAGLRYRTQQVADEMLSFLA